MSGEFGLKPGDTVNLKMPQGTIFSKFGTMYSDVAAGETVVFVVNNLDSVQLSVNLGNFSEKYGIKAGTKIEIDK
jgi:S-adenosylmethionine hydrolase